MRKRWWQCQGCDANFLGQPDSCTWCGGAVFIQNHPADCEFDCWDESWKCGCDYHFHHSTCPATEDHNGVLLHCMSADGHNFSHSAWFHDEITHWLNTKMGAYDGAEEILAMVRGVQTALDDLSEQDDGLLHSHLEN